jgi:hypothetical protein
MYWLWASTDAWVASKRSMIGRVLDKQAEPFNDRGFHAPPPRTAEDMASGEQVSYRLVI